MDVTTLKPGRAFRWTGGPGAQAGTLRILRADGTVALVPPANHSDHQHDPRSIVKKAENLAALGHDQVENFIKQGLAEPLKLIDQALGMVSGDEPAPADDDLARAEKVANDSVAAGKAVLDMANLAKANGAPQANDTRSNDERIRGMQEEDRRGAEAPVMPQ